MQNGGLGRWAGWMVAAVVAAMLPVILGPTVASAACTATSQPDARSAATLALSCDKPVVVDGAMTSTSKVVANPDGTFTSTESALPERVRRSDGTWAAVDVTLKVNPDGSVMPKVSPNPVLLSGGGTGPLAKAVSQNQELVWTWTGIALPKPTLAGSVASYAEVLPGVDLKVRVDEFGFSEVLVVKTAAAAANPALKSLRFALSGSGLTAAGAAGTATTPDAAVSDAFELSAAHMWDSSVPVTKSLAPAVDVASEQRSSIDGPGSSAKVADVSTAMSGSDLVVTPAQSLLTDPTATYPIYIDPKSSAPARSYWSMINSGAKAQEYWDYDRSQHAKVGNAGDGVNMYRSLFQFSTSAWQNKHVTAATFSVGLVHSWSCSNTTTELHLSSQTLSSSTTWNSNASSWGSSLATNSDQNCSDASGIVDSWASSAFTSAVNSGAGSSTITIGLRAASETVSYDGSNGWKKFDETSGSTGAHLSVTYNTAPTMTNLLLDANSCAPSTAPTILSTLNGHAPQPKVTVSDAEADKPTITFTYPNGSGGTTSTSYANVASGTTQSLVNGIPAANLTDGATYWWQATASDGTDSRTSSQCYFKIDNSVPVAPVITSADGIYTDDLTDHGGVGKPGKFTITGTPGITKYVWGTTTPTTTVTTTNGAPVTISFTPTDLGENVLTVIGYNAVNTPSTQGGFTFRVAAPDQPVGNWKLNGDGADAASGGHTATPSAVNWTPDARVIGQSVGKFDGSTSNLTATSPIRTDTSFAVSAWVRPSATCNGNAVSQDGTSVSGFYLGCYQGKFQFDVIPADSSSVASVRISASSAAPAGVWANLVGIYDLSANKISLYVNGSLVNSATLAAPLWNAAGLLNIGRSKYTGVEKDYFAGDISDVRVWDRAIYTSDIAALSASSWAGQWVLSDATGKDSKGSHDLAWHGNPQWTQDDMNSGGASAQMLNSANPDYAMASGPVLRTDGSFTISAWVAPTITDGAYHNAVSQNGSLTANFGLGIRGSNYCFWIHTSNVANAAATVVASTTAATSGAWVHLIGVYDASAKTIALYVNGALVTSTPFTTAWNSDGPLAVGTGLWQGANAYLWNGGIDNVDAFNGVLSATEISNLYNYGDPYHVAP